MGDYIPIALRRQVRERARGICEYCLIPEAAVLAAHETDHVIPQKHGGLTEFGNLALSCALCNRYKGSDLASLDPETGDIFPFYNPRCDRWTDHFRLEHAQIIPLTPIGCVTVRIFQINNPERVRERELLIASGIYLADGLWGGNAGIRSKKGSQSPVH